LRAHDTGSISTYTTHANGRYMLWAKPGTYDLTAWADSYTPHQEILTVHHRASYVGFNLALRRRA
jgi:hypothetical protein